MNDAAPVARLALVGSPNSGKTSVFNALTGLHHKVANYAGVTVERAEGEARVGDQRVTIIDLPGTYSMEPMSPDEHVTVDVLRGSMPGCPAPDGVIVVADATALDRGLAAAAEIITLGLPTVLVLTMIDELKARGGAIDIGKLRRRLGIHVVGVVGNRGLGIDDLRALLPAPASWPIGQTPIPTGSDANAIHQRFAWASHIAGDAVVEPTQRSGVTERLDAVLLHPVGGVVAFVAAMVVFFQVIFAVAAPLQDLFEGLVGAFGAYVASVLPDGLLESLLVDGVIAGVGSVVVFVPQIALLLVLIALFEGSGYMARAAFIVDRVMGWAGLEGRSFVALLSSYACAIPGILAARTVPDPRTRLATILAAPLMTCSARLPVYALLIGAFVPRQTVLGVFNLQGLVLFGLYAAGAGSAFLAAAIVRRTARTGVTWPFYMQLPPYRVPARSVVIEQVWRGVRSFLVRAGSVILVGSVVVWALLAFPGHTLTAEEEAAAIEAGLDPVAVAGALTIEDSYAARIGRSVAPIFEPLGYDWRINVGIIASFGAREVIVATLAQTYAFAGGEDDLDGLGAQLGRELGGPRGGLPVALSLLAFYIFALQCVSTLAVLRREAGSWKWAVGAWVWYFAVAWLAALAAYRVGLALVT